VAAVATAAQAAVAPVATTASVEPAASAPHVPVASVHVRSCLQQAQPRAQANPQLLTCPLLASELSQLSNYVSALCPLSRVSSIC
jgi:hypothetical protein